MMCMELKKKSVCHFLNWISDHQNMREGNLPTLFFFVNLFLNCRNSAKSREGALLGFECLCETLGRIFEP